MATSASGPIPTGGIDGILGYQAALSQAQTGNYTIKTFLASLVASIVIFAVQFVIFLLIKGKLPRIFQPKSFLVSERERVAALPEGLWKWLVPVFTTATNEFISKCGLDAYFFLRYLEMLLKIFVPSMFLIMPILIPLNAVGGRGPTFATGIYGNASYNGTWHNVTGLNELAWGNILPTETNRYWAHLVLAVIVVLYCCFIFYDELRNYVRMRQVYLTSPQHRLRASATTVLVQSIPQKWCTQEALAGLYDVFPGGVRKIWINRDFSPLQDKVSMRDKLAKKLESAETALIRKAKTEHAQKLKKEAKAKKEKKTKEQIKAEEKANTEQAKRLASGAGFSTGDPHQVMHNVNEVIDAEQQKEKAKQESEKAFIPFQVISGGIGRVGQGIGAFGQGIGTFGKGVVGGIRNLGREKNDEEIQPIQQKDFALAEAGESSQSSLRTVEQIPLKEIEQKPAPPSEPVSDGQIEPSSSHSDPQELSQLDGTAETKEKPQLKLEMPGTPTSNEQLSRWNIVTEIYKQLHHNTYNIPSPIPQGYEGEEYPLAGAHVSNKQIAKSMFSLFRQSDEARQPTTEYPEAIDAHFNAVEDNEPAWKQYVKQKDRDTMRLPIFGQAWLGWLSVFGLGKKVDKIEYCRAEVARLNLEIESDQQKVEDYPLMNSAFIQFNHQVAAHMACQSLNHHAPSAMTPRLVEMSPNDVHWGNMSLQWFERLVRTYGAVAILVGLIIGWAFPVAFTGLLSQISYLASYSWLSWLNRIPAWFISVIQGILPQALLALLLLLLPVILRALAKLQGLTSGMAVELRVQDFYFYFLFVQVFLVITLSTGITNVLSQISQNVTNIPGILATNLPKASNYFFSYLLLQALSTSAGALLQPGSLFMWFIWAVLVDSTAREKWKRQVNLPNMQWGTFFPVYTNLACIGLIYSVIAPLILLFNVLTFLLFWIAFRYNTLYVTKFQFDTGGLLFPKAINQTFVGLYFLELCLIGLFFLVTSADASGMPVDTPCKAQGIIMIVVLVLTAAYQIFLNQSFQPLFRYLPITLEDDAVARDKAFAREQAKRWGYEIDESDDEDEEESEHKSLTKHDHDATDTAENGTGRLNFNPLKLAVTGTKKVGWAARARTRQTRAWVDRAGKEIGSTTLVRRIANPIDKVTGDLLEKVTGDQKGLALDDPEDMDVEAQLKRRGTLTEDINAALFAGIHDEIEDLTPQERDVLVAKAFQHSALRARRPVIWIPRDELGVSDDEIKRTQRLAGENIWISNEGTGLDAKAKVIFRRSPPDFSEVDLIEL